MSFQIVTRLVKSLDCLDTMFGHKLTLGTNPSGGFSLKWNNLCRNLQFFLKRFSDLLQTQASQILARSIRVLVSKYSLNMSNRVTFSIQDTCSQVPDGVEPKTLYASFFIQPFHKLMPSSKRSPLVLFTGWYLLRFPRTCLAVLASFETGI